MTAAMAARLRCPRRRSSAREPRRLRLAQPKCAGSQSSALSWFTLRLWQQATHCRPPSLLPSLPPSTCHCGRYPPLAYLSSHSPNQVVGGARAFLAGSPSSPSGRLSGGYSLQPSPESAHDACSNYGAGFSIFAMRGIWRSRHGTLFQRMANMESLAP